MPALWMLFHDAVSNYIGVQNASEPVYGVYRILLAPDASAINEER